MQLMMRTASSSSFFLASFLGDKNGCLLELVLATSAGCALGRRLTQFNGCPAEMSFVFSSQVVSMVKQVLLLLLTSSPTDLNTSVMELALSKLGPSGCRRCFLMDGLGEPRPARRGEARGRGEAAAMRALPRGERQPPAPGMSACSKWPAPYSCAVSAVFTGRGYYDDDDDSGRQKLHS